MLIIEQIGASHVLLVEAVVCRLVASNEENRRTTRIEGLEDAYRGPRPYSEFSHVAVAGAPNPGRVGEGEAGTVLDEIRDDVADRVLMANGQAIPPSLELVGVFD